MRAELELIKTKYEKKIQGLMINNNELNARVKNLMNSLITLKDYTLNIERNTNNNNSNYMNNNSMFIKNKNNSFTNEEFGNYNKSTRNKKNYLTYQPSFNTYNFEENNKKSKELLDRMNNMLKHIDTKIYDENGELLGS